MLRARAAPPMRVAFSLVRVVDRCPGLARFGTRLRNDRVSHALFVPALHWPLDLVSAVLVGCRCAARVDRAPGRGVGAAILSSVGCLGQAATVGRVTVGASLRGAM